MATRIGHNNNSFKVTGLHFCRWQTEQLQSASFTKPTVKMQLEPAGREQLDFEI